jgi:ribA/ribD-fused uncharacterized protein
MTQTQPTHITNFAGPYSFLSNFYRHRVSVQGVWYPSNEHAFQAAKTLDLAARLRIASAPTPRDAKHMGRQVTLRLGWNEHVRYEVMELLIATKFMASSLLAKQLASTNQAVLVEGNTWHDNVWGNCVCSSAECLRPGANILGWMLMRQRSWLINAGVV